MMHAKAAMILEDEPIVAFALEDMLLELGVEEVRLATKIAEARDHLERTTPDFAILDVNIHGERSYGIAELLVKRGVPILFATGYGDAEHPSALSHIPTLTKPYGRDDLQAALSLLTCPDKSANLR